MIILTEGPKDSKHKMAIDAILATSKRYGAPVKMIQSDKDLIFKFNDAKDADTVYLFAKDSRDLEGWRLSHDRGSLYVSYDDDRRED